MSDEELLALAAKHGVAVNAPAEPARMSDADLLALALKHGISTRQQAPESLSPNETFAASLAPKGIISSLYGASEAAPTLFKEGFSPALGKYRKERDYARGLLDNSAKENPRAALAGNVAGIAPFAVAAGPEIAAQAALSGAYSLADSKADLTRLDDPEQRAARRAGTWERGCSPAPYWALLADTRLSRRRSRAVGHWREGSAPEAVRGNWWGLAPAFSVGVP
jgi:hypothetical protein